MQFCLFSKQTTILFIFLQLSPNEVKQIVNIKESCTPATNTNLEVVFNIIFFLLTHILDF